MRSIKYFPLLIVVAFLFATFHGIGQEYFSKQYDITGFGLWNYGTTVLQVEDGYLVGAETCWPSSSSRKRVSIVMLNNQGTQQWIRYYEQNAGGYGYGVGFAGFLVQTIPSGFALTGTRRDPYPGWIRDRGFLFQLDDNYDTIWTQLYGDLIEPCDTELLLRQVSQVNSGGFSLYGGIMDYNDQRPHLTLIRTNNTGEPIWQKFYGPPPDNFLSYSFCCTSDQGFILGGFQYNEDPQSYDPVLFKVDSVGNEEWFLNLGSEFLDYPAFVDTTYNGKIIVGTVIADSMIYPDNFYGRICFTKIDNEGNIIWQKRYGTSHINNQLWSVKSLKNGKIVATGCRQRHYPEVPWRFGWIFCSDSVGDSLWYREYTLVNGANSENLLFDIIQSNDSGFVACGYVDPIPPDTGTQSTWVIKVDSMGCELPDYCWTDINDNYFFSPNSSKLIAFPNPASQSVAFNRSGLHFLSDSEIIIYNVFGEVILEFFVPTDCKSMNIDISSLLPGIYLVKLESQDGLYGSTKLIVE